MKMKTAYSEPVFSEKRLVETISFIGEFMHQPILAIGAESEFEIRLRDFYNEKFDFTDFDLHHQFPITRKYQTILCFEVIEHLLNPLLLLTECKKLMKNDSLLYLSYPVHNLKIFWDSGHFHEYDKSRFRYLISEANFEILNYKEKVTRSKKIGIRPILKNTPIGWFKHQYYCLRKKH